MKHQLLLVHGRGFKPTKRDFSRLWRDALRAGFERDRPDLLPALNEAHIEVVYYADLSAEWLTKIGKKPREGDLQSRRATLNGLKQLKKSQFGERHYNSIRGLLPAYEALADALDYPITFLRLGESLFEKYAPEIREYWADVHLGSDLRLVVAKALERAMKRVGPICLVGHSLGSILSYDVLWQMSHSSFFRHAKWNRQVELLVTLGAPLANQTIREHLKGAVAPEEFRYPTNVGRWINIAAEDDIIAHDETIVNDFRPMRKTGCKLTDHHIYNPAIRNGKPNPHEGVGYLIHPRTVKMLANWLEQTG